MIAFEVADMSCGHCVSMITKAVKQTDQAAVIDVDLASKRVQIESTVADETTFKAAIEKSGYSPVSVAAAVPSLRRTGGSCCGGAH